jgi:hypothetical protein
VLNPRQERTALASFGGSSRCSGNGRSACGSELKSKRMRFFRPRGCKPIRLHSNAPKRRAATKWRGTGASWRRRSPAGRAGAYLCSTPYSVEREDEGALRASNPPAQEPALSYGRNLAVAERLLDGRTSPPPPAICCVRSTSIVLKNSNFRIDHNSGDRWRPR